MIFVSHDRYFLDRIADGIVEISEGEVHRHTGGYSDWRRSAFQPAACLVSTAAARFGPLQAAFSMSSKDLPMRKLKC